MIQKELKDTLRRTAGVIAGGLLYVVLNWIPLIGAGAVGLHVGYALGKGFKNGFKHAIYAAALGTILVFYAFFGYILNGAVINPFALAFIAWVLLVWNMTAILIAGLAGGFGAIGRDLHHVVPEQIKNLFTPPPVKPKLDYIICTSCGQGNLDHYPSCSGCGHGLK